MHLRKRAWAAVIVAAAACTVLGPRAAVAAPMPWETSRTPAVVTHHTDVTAGEHGTVTVLCGTPCYQ